jgi:hypothetical protein
MSPARLPTGRSVPRHGREGTSRRPGTAAVETARYTALEMDLWKTFDWISSEADSPGIFCDGHRGRAVRRLCVHPASVAVYHLGNNGTARKLLKAWPVTG